MKRGTISCPSASKKSTQGTRANNFSTQIGYSNYPRLFNLATRLEALFQVPSINTAAIGGSGLDSPSFSALHHFGHDEQPWIDGGRVLQGQQL